MNDTFEIVFIVGMIAMLIMYVVCMIKESKIIGYYKAANLFGRIYAVFASNFLLSGVIGTIAIIIMIIGALAGADMQIGVGMLFIYLLACIAYFAIGFYMYYRVAKKVPDYMRKRTLIDLTICGFGAMFRTALFIWMFFFKTWWEFSKPEEYTLEKTGQTVMVFPDGNVYDSSTSRFGKLTDDGKAVIWN